MLCSCHQPGLIQMSDALCRHEAIDVHTWLPGYVRRRYGEVAPVAIYRAWQLLQSSVYNATDGHLDHATDIPTSHPALGPEENRSQWGLRPHLWYDPQLVSPPAS